MREPMSTHCRAAGVEEQVVVPSARSDCEPIPKNGLLFFPQGKYTLTPSFAAAGEPEIDRIAQAFMIDTGPAVDRPQQQYRPVGRRPPVVHGNAVEAGLDIAAANSVERAGKPVAQMALRFVAIEVVGLPKPPVAT